MQRIIGMIILVFWGASTMLAQQYHYYYQGKQVPLDLNTSYAYLVLDGISTEKALAQTFGDVEVAYFGDYNPARTLNEVAGTTLDRPGTHWAEVKFRAPLTKRDYERKLREFESHSKVVVAQSAFTTEKAPGELLASSDLFVVKTMSPEGEQVLYDMAAENNVQVLGRNRFMPEWFTLSVTKESKGDALEMANAFYESHFFATAEPDLMVENLSHCVNDPLFPDQWGHDNTATNPGTPGIDINACAGWANWGIGTATTQVAVLDHGYEQNHPDLMGNNVGVGFDTDSGTSPSVVWGSHGTACAGIVAATQNNNLGVSGVGAGLGIMSVSNRLVLHPNVQQELADGLNWSWQNGAEVISNSWGSNALASALIDNAITACVTNGRGGLGTVVCFSAGNGNGAVAYPANSNPEIIAVGAMSPCGERKNPASCDGETWWGSDSGAELDVMAPGVLVPTTDRQGGAGYAAGDYAPTFNGTSAACPHVAGLAGMVISMNPCLTQHQVADILERTAQKVGGYAYANVAGRPNGTWFTEMGYGLIDVDRAMQMTRELLLQNMTISDTRTYQVHGTIAAGSNVDPSQPVGPFTVASGGNVTFRASGVITLAAGFNVNLGGTFTTENISTACADWDQTARRPNPELADEVEAPVVDEAEAVSAILDANNTVAVSPNPFNDRLVLGLGLERDANVAVSMYNFHGQVVADLMPEAVMQEGRYLKTFELGQSLPQGIYILRVEVDGVITSKKLVKQ